MELLKICVFQYNLLKTALKDGFEEFDFSVKSKSFFKSNHHLQNSPHLLTLLNAKKGMP